MILFFHENLLSLSQSISLLGHRHPGKKAVFLTQCNGFSESRFAKQLVANDVFLKIVYVPYTSPKDREKALDEQEIDMLRQFDCLFSENKIDLNDIEQIYVGGDNVCDLPIYLSMNGMQYVLMEYSPNQLYNECRLSGPTDFPIYSELLRKYSALDGANNKHAVKRLRFGETGLGGIKPDFLQTIEKDEWVNFNHLWQTLPVELKQKLSQSLDHSSQSLNDEHSCLILGNSLGRIADFSELIIDKANILYQLLADYYASGYNLIIKDHPHSVGNVCYRNFPIKNYLEDAVDLDGFVPVEFFALSEDFFVHKSISIESNATVAIKQLCTKNIFLGMCFYSHFHFLHKTFCIFSLAQKIATPATAFYASGIDMEFLEKFVECCFPEFNVKELKDRPKDTNQEEAATIIIGNISAENRDEVVNLLENAAENTKVMLLNVKNVKNQWSVMPQNFVPITIIKKATKEAGFLDCLDSELFYFYSPNPVIMEAVQSFTLEKTLKHTKLHLSVRALPPVSTNPQASVANFIDSWGYHTEKDNPILKQLQLCGKFEKDFPVNLIENDDPSSLKIQLLGELLSKQDMSKKANDLNKQIETLKNERNNIAAKIEELIAENARVIAESVTLMKDIVSLRLPRWLGHFLSNLHPKKKNRQRFREKYVKGKKK